jgi:hypothetical protein
MISIQRKIWLERAGILSENLVEEESKDSKSHYSFLHPSKGMYKLSHHPQDNIYHVHNKFGDLSHTFSGHMTPKEVADTLKKEHDMILVDKLQEQQLQELAPFKSDQAKKESAALNIHRGGYNETQVAKHLNGGKFIDKEHEQQDKHHKAQLANYDKKHGQNEVKTQEDRAKEQARVFKEHAKKKGYEGIHQVHLTPKPGDIERKTGIKATQQENPSDVIVKFHKKPKDASHAHLGLSAKSSAAKHIGFHNGGTKEIGNFLQKHLG